MGPIGSPGYTYDENIERWGKAPPGWIHHRIADIAFDGQVNVYAYVRGEPWVMVFGPNGDLLRTWGGGYFKMPHGITVGIDGSALFRVTPGCAADRMRVIHWNRGTPRCRPDLGRRHRRAAGARRVRRIRVGGRTA